MSNGPNHSKLTRIGKVGARVFFGIVAVLLALVLVDDVHRGSVSGECGIFPASRVSEPGLFWIYVGAWLVIIAATALMAVRGFGNTDKS
jgi:hypothetical protein